MKDIYRDADERYGVTLSIRYAFVIQLAEYDTSNVGVAGSSPAGRTNNFFIFSSFLNMSGGASFLSISRYSGQIKKYIAG